MRLCWRVCLPAAFSIKVSGAGDVGRVTEAPELVVSPFRAVLRDGVGWGGCAGGATQGELWGKQGKLSSNSQKKKYNS